MPGPAHPPELDLLIVGGGAAGTLAAIHALALAGADARIAMVEPGSAPGRGVAYSTPRPEHVLNVPAQRMSAFPARPDDFVDYLAEAGGGDSRDGIAGSYAQRRHYGDYLGERLRQARADSAAGFRVVRDRVERLDLEGGSARVTLASGAALSARAVVLAVGNRPRPLPGVSAVDLPPGTCLQAWDYDALARIATDEDVCIVGSGLTMVDCALSLARQGHRGGIHVLSRHALLPLPHAASHSGAAPGLDVAALHSMGLRRRTTRLRQAARDAQQAGLPWQAVMDQVRPQVQALWQSLSAAEQRRFRRHAVRHWDVHRHRIAPQVHEQLQALRSGGQLLPQRGRLLSVAAHGSRLVLDLRRPDATRDQLRVDRVLNATGVELRAAQMDDPLLSQLIDTGQARPGPHGIGLDTDTHGRLLDSQGNVHAGAVAIGSLRIGQLWESLAVPELRGQAEAAARLLLGPRPA